jgi:hypothetical protein
MSKVEGSQETNPFLAQTAFDYNLPYHEVERIHRCFPNEFYEKLEELIKVRINQ